MNKKFVAVIGLSSALLLGSVYSISASTSGYEAYKSALKNTHEFASSTMEMNFQMEDNGHELFSGNTTMKSADEGLVQIKTAMKNENDESTVEMFRQNGQTILKKDEEDTYYVMKKKQGNHFHKEGGEELRKDFEKLVDAATKNIQDNISLSPGKDGSKQMEMKLSAVEIPMTANVISSLMLKHASMMEDREFDANDFHRVRPNLPDLKENIRIKEISIEATINKRNYIEDQDITAVVAGEDKQGKTHEIKLEINIELSNMNNTELVPVQLDGKKTVAIESKHGHFER